LFARGLGLFGALALIATLAQEDDWDLAPPAPVVPLRPAVLPDADSHACATCHADVVEEWAASAHALAWVDEEYRKSLRKKRRPQLCYGCHVPEPLLVEPALAGKPPAREDLREHGISCESCHLGPGGEMLGPRGTVVDAHPSAASELLRAPGSNELCSACHATNIGPVIGVARDFAQSKQAEKGRSCVACHMALVERRWAEGEGVPVRVGRSHALQTPRDPSFLRRAFGLELITLDGASALVIENLAAHRVPGLIGRVILFRARLLDDEGDEVETAELKLDERAYLPVDERRTLRFEERGTTVEVRGLHTDPRAKEAVTFLEESFHVD